MRAPLLRFEMTVTRVTIVAAVVALTLGLLIGLEHYAESGRTESQQVDFNRDVRPILNQHCTSCHGGVKQVNGVSFIYREEALGRGKSGRPTIVPRHPERSELIARLTTADPEARMPYRAPPLSSQQIDVLRQWVREGAHWAEHWAFVPPKPQKPPSVYDKQWPRQALDRFVLARLEQEGIQPSPEAGKAALLRRVSFDLTGLPPTPEELAAFLLDAAPGAYERQVDRLLASPHFGERWAALWLDLARYADSRGYEKDMSRPMWPYRDWVIDAFNKNISYDEFVIKQLAGDLLPDPTFEDLIATAFHRQTPVNDEGGTDDEEFRLTAVMDRAATTWSVLNGVTFNCTQCHSHPYDPIRHEEYYKFLAFFNVSRDADRLDDWPTLKVPKDKSRRDEAYDLNKKIDALRREIVAQGRTITEQSQWTALPITEGTVNEALGVERSLEQLKREYSLSLAHQKPSKQLQPHYDALIASTTASLERARRQEGNIRLQIRNGEARAIGTVPSVSVYQILAAPLPAGTTAIKIEIRPLDSEQARRNPEEGFIVNQVEAWMVSPNGYERKIVFHQFVPDSEENLDGLLKGRTAGGDVSAANISFAANPKLYHTRWLVSVLDEPVGAEPTGHLKLQLTHMQSISEREALARHIKLSVSDDERWKTFGTDQTLKEKTGLLVDLELRQNQMLGVSLPIMAEQRSYERRETFTFERGNMFTKVGPPLAAGVPALFPKLPAGQPRNRLTMARWFFQPGQPLTARVAVNRFWEQLFGTGLVETLEDFGSVGEEPSHPELLDWLALHFQNDLHWDMKAFLRDLVVSSTYRQSAAVTPELLQKDPRNRLLARGPRQRLSAEMVRDQALLASGLLAPSLGGEPVMPPQPASVGMTVYNSQAWVNATGSDRYRRAIYTLIKRSALYPSLVTFDAADHVVSLARRTPTNTPLQALVTLNDPVYYEAAEALAKQMQQASGFAARSGEGARRVLSRDLSPEERQAMEALYKDAYMLAGVSKQTSKSAANKDLIALTAVASALLNLDAALTR